MTIAPFLILKLRRKKDVVLARQRARRVASLLSFEPMEQACVAAGAFLIASQALSVLGGCRLCFQLEHGQLHIFAESGESAQLQVEPASRLTGLFSENESGNLFRLAKPIPSPHLGAAPIEIGWLVKKLEESAHDGVFAEIAKQNQEMLALLHELRLYRGELSLKEKKAANPHAA